MDDLLLQVRETMEKEKEKADREWKCNMKSYFGQLFNRRKTGFLRLFTGYDKMTDRDVVYLFLEGHTSEVKKASIEKKIWVYNQIGKVLEKMKKEKSILEYVLKSNVVNKEERVRVLTNVGDVNSLLFIEKEERDRLSDILIKINLLSFQKEVGIPNETLEEEYLECLIAFEDSPYINDINFSRFLIEDTLKTYFEVDGEKIKKLKEIMIRWYEESGEKIFKIDFETVQIKEIKKYSYLFSDKKRKEIIEKLENRVQKEFEKVMQEIKYVHPNENIIKLKQIESELEEIRGL